MVTKLVENVNDDVWNRFAGYCKAKDKKIGELLSEIVDDFLFKEDFMVEEEQPQKKKVKA